MTPAELKEIRLKLNLSQETVAEETGFSRANISKWESGKLKMSTSTISHLTLYFEKKSRELNIK